MSKCNTIVALGLVAGCLMLVSATDAFADRHGGGSRGGGGGSGGAPLPALGVTLLGQAIGAGGFYVIWRRRRKK